MLSQALPVALLAVAVDALPWAGPMVTPAAVLENAAPKEELAVMTAPSILPRDDEYLDPTICAWVKGDPSLPATCSTHSKCVWNTDYKIVGCCTTKGTECGVYTSCVDKNSSKQGDSPNVYTCIGDDLCYLNSFPNGFYQYGCGKTEWAATVLTSYSGYDGSPKLQIIYTGTGDASSSSSAASSSSSASAAASSGSAAAPVTVTVGGGSHSSGAAPAATSSGAAAGDSGDGGSSKPVGAIAGGTVGGVAALALVGALIFFFMRRNKNKDAKSSGTDVSGNNNYDPSAPNGGATAAAAVGAGAGAAAAKYPYSSPPVDQPVMAELDTPKPMDSMSMSQHPGSSVSPLSELETPRPHNRDSAAWSALPGRQSVPPLEAPQEAVEMP